MKDIEILKTDRENKIIEHMRILDKERENYRQKMNEWE
jgi:hypothetical protein